jgi:thiosulfate/3-mercaptopyruvate sulfurtransferase
MIDDALPGPLVPPDWLGERLGAPRLVVVDASWYLSALNRSAVGEYQAGHVAGAVFWDLDTMSDRASPLPHMLPDAETLGRRIGILGIGNDDRVVVYDGSGNNLSAARIWWTLRVAGHDAVAVLDGGLAAWRAAGRPLRAGWAPWAPTRFVARYRPELVRSREAVRDATAGGRAQILDARAKGRFEGTEPEPRPGLRAGHMPGAKNLPYPELTGIDGRMLPVEALRARIAIAGIDPARPVITSCGSGVTACVLALALEIAGHREWSVYDGSWAEWGLPDGPEIEIGPREQ